MKRAIITGASGFLGSRLVRKLSNSCEKVYAVVRNKEKAKQFQELKNVEVIQCEMSDYSNLHNYIDDKIDVVYHLAWSGTTGSERSDYNIQLSNAAYTCDAINSARKLGVEKFIFAGSIIEYEYEKSVQSKCENISVNNIYGIGKITASKMGRVIAESQGMSFIKLIISNIYGPGEINERLVNSTMKKFLRNESTEFTPCNQLYDFIYVDDAMEALYLIGHEKNNYNEYYIGNKKPKKLKEYIYTMKDCVNEQIEPGIGKIDFNGISLEYTEFDTNTLYKDFNYKPQVDFIEGINRTKQWLVKEGTY